jgi:hypothetical protein
MTKKILQLMLKLLLIANLTNLVIFQTVSGEVSTRVYLWDANTPLEIGDANKPFYLYPPDPNLPIKMLDPNNPFLYRDIMVGTKLVITIDSNAAKEWSGGLFLIDANRDYGVLSGRDFNDITFDWEGSRFNNAGSNARVFEVYDNITSGFDCYGDIDATAGKWFIFDYNATKLGTCQIGFYDYSVDWFEPIYKITFNQVPTRDFNNDKIVDFNDFSIFASCWQLNDCNEAGWCRKTYINGIVDSNSYVLTNCNSSGKCGKVDLDKNGIVDINDFLLFADFWLERTEKTIVEPNLPEPNSPQSLILPTFWR